MTSPPSTEGLIERCPFCDHESFLREPKGMFSDQFVCVVCTNCGTTSEKFHAATCVDPASAAIASWNTRTPPTPVPLGDILGDVLYQAVNEGPPDDVLVRALKQIEAGAKLGQEMFASRMKGKKSLTWAAVNVLQDNLSACEGTAREALARFTQPKGGTDGDLV